MHKHANPIEFLIDFAWANGADLFTVNNAKDELKKIRSQLDNIPKYYDIGCVQVNKNGDLYCLRFQYNEHIENAIPIYANKEELKNFLDKSR